MRGPPSRSPFALLIAAAACSAGTEAKPVDVTGRWAFTETFTDFPHGITCADTGSYDITQTGTTFSGQYAQRGICKTPTGVSAGRVVGHTLSFRVTVNCEYSGNAAGMPPRELSGRGVCVLLDGQDTLRFSGTWRATR
jgi:hypothetical protein